MIVILVVALIVVGPDKLPELARSLAKGVQELKRTMNQVKESLDEENLLGEVEEEIRKTADEVQDHLLDDETRTWKGTVVEQDPDEEELDLQPLEERPWEKERKKEPDPLPSELNRASGEEKQTDDPPGGGQADPSPGKPV